METKKKGIKTVNEKGKCVLSVSDKGGTRRHYRYKGRELVVVVTGSTGFIVTAYPHRIKQGDDSV